MVTYQLSGGNIPRKTKLPDEVWSEVKERMEKKEGGRALSKELEERGYTISHAALYQRFKRESETVSYQSNQEKDYQRLLQRFEELEERVKILESGNITKVTTPHTGGKKKQTSPMKKEVPQEPGKKLEEEDLNESILNFCSNWRNMDEIKEHFKDCGKSPKTIGKRVSRLYLKKKKPDVKKLQRRGKTTPNFEFKTDC